MRPGASAGYRWGCCCLGPLTLADVAAAVGKSPAYVTTALTRATGCSAGQWIVSGRLAEARRLLLHSDEMVDVIAERVDR
jgi:AraC-like DNA-binding protein